MKLKEEGYLLKNIKLEENKIKDVSIREYHDVLGISKTMLLYILKGKKATRLVTAKAIISYAYKLDISDKEIDSLVNKYFTKVKIG